MNYVDRKLRHECRLTIVKCNISFGLLTIMVMIHYMESGIVLVAVNI